MNLGRARRLTRAIQGFDRDLFVKRDGEHLSIKRKASTYDVFDWGNGKLFVSRPFEHHVMCLTENWNVNTKPVEWGVEPILARLKAISLATNPELFKDLMSGYEKKDESKQRDFRNNVESFLLEFRPQFAKAFNDVNTSTMEKIDKRRLYDGYRK